MSKKSTGKKWRCSEGTIFLLSLATSARSMILRGIASRFGEKLLSSHKFSVFDRRAFYTFNILQYPSILVFTCWMMQDQDDGVRLDLQPSAQRRAGRRLAAGKADCIRLASAGKGHLESSGSRAKTAARHLRTVDDSWRRQAKGR